MVPFYCIYMEITEEIKERVANSANRDEAVKILTSIGYSHIEAREKVREIFNLPNVLEERKKLYNNGKNSQIWTEDRLTILQNNYNQYGYNEGASITATQLGLTNKQCKEKLRKLGYNPNIYRPIEGEIFKEFHPNYFISNKGRVKHVTNSITKILKGSINSDGYISIRFQDGNNHLNFTIHRLVAQYFIPNPDNKPQVDHIDTDRTNNDVTNLRWTTGIENMANTLTRQHLADSKHWVRYFQVLNKETGEIYECFSESNLYNYLGLTYINLHPGTTHFKEYDIIMQINENINYSIGRWLRMGNTKEQIKELIDNYSEEREYIDYLKEQKGTP